MSDRARPDPPPAPRVEGEGRSEEAIREELDRIVLGALSPISTGLALLYAVFTVAHGLLLPPSQAGPLMVAAGVSVIVLGGFRLSLVRWTPPPRLAHPLATAIAGVVLLNSLLHLSVTGEPRETTNLLLLILGVGIVFLDGGWFAAVVAAVFAGWVGVLPTGASESGWTHFGFALLGATILATAILQIRMRTFRRIEELHFQDRMKQLELEAALARTEVARQGEREAREAVEAAVQELQESEERFRRLANASYEGVVVQQDSVIVDANARAARLFGYRPGSLVGRSLGELVREEDRQHVVGFLEGLVDPDREAIQTEGVRKNGESFSLEVRRAAATHKGKEAFVGVLRDVTEQMEVEKMLRRAAAEAQASSRAKSSFLANMSHELRTPLNSVIGFANVLRKNSSGNLSGKELGFVDRIISNGELLLELIGEVLDLSKVEAGRMEPSAESVDLSEVVEEAVRTVELQAERKGIELRTRLPEDLGTIETDPDRLRQILVNLLGNGVKFTEAGHVEVRVEADEDGRPVHVRVSDTGPGIPEDRRAHIFDAFTQADDTTSRRYGGTGLGLTICRTLADLLGFTIDVESEVDEGTSFTVVLDPEVADGVGHPREGDRADSTGGDAEGASGRTPTERTGTSPNS